MTPDKLVEDVADVIGWERIVDADGGYPLMSVADLDERKRIATAAIVATLRGIREATPEMIEAGALEPMPEDYWATTIFGQGEIAAAARWQAMIDQYLSTLPGGDNG